MKTTNWFLTTLFCLIALTAFAHGGGLDSNGGHHDRKNGGYHYHRPKSGGQTGRKESSAFSGESFTRDLVTVQASRSCVSPNVGVRGPSWEEVANIIAHNKFTHLQQRDFWERHNGKTVCWTGTVCDAFSNCILVSMQPSPRGIVVVNLKAGQRDRVLSCKIGSEVTFFGELHGDITDINVHDAEIGNGGSVYGKVYNGNRNCVVSSPIRQEAPVTWVYYGPSSTSETRLSPEGSLTNKMKSPKKIRYILEIDDCGRKYTIKVSSVKKVDGGYKDEVCFYPDNIVKRVVRLY